MRNFTLSNNPDATAILMDYSGTCDKCGAKQVTVTSQSLCVPCAETIPMIHGKLITRNKSSKGEETIFVPLPRALWRECQGGCCCEYCSDNPKVSQPAFWDTLVIDAKAPKAGRTDYVGSCHYPALQGAQPKRKDALLAEGGQ